MVWPVRWPFPFPQRASFRRSGSSRGSPVARAGGTLGRCLRQVLLLHVAEPREDAASAATERRTEKLGSSASWDDGQGVPLATPSGETFPLINTTRYCCYHASHADVPGQGPSRLCTRGSRATGRCN